jgi:hypothetical protein
MSHNYAATDSTVDLQSQARWRRLKSSIDLGEHRQGLGAFVARLDDEPDAVVADSARGYLIRAGQLSDWELSRLSERAGFERPPLDRIIADERAWRDASDAKSEAEFLQAAQSGFVKAQLRLLDRPAVPIVTLEYLAIYGRIRAIRERAAQLQMRRSL